MDPWELEHHNASTAHLAHHKKWAAAKKQLETFQESQEGQRTVNTINEEKAVIHFTDMLMAQEKNLADQIAYLEKQKFEAEQKLNQLTSSKPANILFAEARLQSAKERLAAKQRASKSKEEIRLQKIVDEEWAALLRTKEAMAQALESRAKSFKS